MTKKSANQEGQAKAKAKADAAQAEQQSSWRNYKAKELARNPSMSVESLHSRFKAMSATQKAAYRDVEPSSSEQEDGGQGKSRSRKA